MHKWAECIMKNVKAKVDEIGLDNMDNTNICELEKWSKIAKDIAEYDYYYNIIKAMEESDYEYSKYGMSVNDYKAKSPEYWRDMDKQTKGVMYYTETIPQHSKYDTAKHGYMDGKTTHPNDDTSNMKAMEMLFSVLEGDMQELKPKMSTNEKNMARNKLNNLANMLM